jgi:hypothetical protein
LNKNTTATPARQSQENPLVRIVYDPENALAVLGASISKTVTRVLDVMKITNVKELSSASDVLSDAEIEAERVNVFLAGLRERVQESVERFAVFDGFEGIQVTLTVRRWPKWNQLQDGISAIKSMRARFNAAEDRRIKQAQADADANQRRINQRAADEAAKAAKKAGADPESVKQIKQEVLATPAPIVESKAQQIAQDVGAGLRYKWTARITSLKSFLGFCLNNPVMLATLGAAIPEIERAFRKMADDQKEQFKYPGIEYVKTPVDVSRGGR